MSALLDGERAGPVGTVVISWVADQPRARLLLVEALLAGLREITEE